MPNLTVAQVFKRSGSDGTINSASYPITITNSGADGAQDDDYIILDLGTSQSVNSLQIADLTLEEVGSTVRAYVTDVWNEEVDWASSSIRTNYNSFTPGNPATVSGGGDNVGRYIYVIMSADSGFSGTFGEITVVQSNIPVPVLRGSARLVSNIPEIDLDGY